MSPLKKKSLTNSKKTTKRNSVSQLKKKADKYFSQAVRLRDADRNGIVKCITCDKRDHWKNMQAGHFVSRRVNALRFDSENVNGQCMPCNVHKHGEQYIYAKELDLKYGEGTAQKLHERRYETHKFTSQELLEIIEDAKKEIAFYEKGDLS